MTEYKQNISFSWNIHFKCNYRCPYCWFHREWAQLRAKYNCSFTSDDLLRSWQRIYDQYGSVHIDILGGEPFLYPRFIETITHLSSLHSLTITTNLFFDVRILFGKISPARVKVTPSFHPLFATLDDFIEKLSVLRDNGFNNGAILVAYPPYLKNWGYYKNEFEKKSLSLGLFPFWGKHNNMDYPQSYTEMERDMIRPYIASRGGEMFQLEPKKIKKGSFCRAGQIYAVIQPDGTTRRCGWDFSAKLIGNIFDDNFKLLDAPAACNSECCACNEWAFLLLDE